MYKDAQSLVKNLRRQKPRKDKKDRLGKKSALTLISVSDSDGRGNCEEELAIISIIKDVSYMRYYFTVTKLFLF